MVREDAISVRQAATRMNVSEQRVRAMARAGRIPAAKVGRDWLIDPEGASALRAPAGRPLSADAAWAALALLAGDRPRWVDPSVSSRLRRRIREDAGWLERSLLHCQPRSRILRWRALPSDLPKIAAEPGLVHTGLSSPATKLDVVALGEGLDAYVGERTLESIARRYRPGRSSLAANVVLRVPSRDWVLHRGSHAPDPVVAADLLPSDDPRVRRAAHLLLSELLDG